MNNFHEFCMELLRWKKGVSAHEHALLVTSGMKFVCARSNGRATGTAIVNVIQAAIDAGCDLASAYIYSTAGLTWACAGMARLQTRGGWVYFSTSVRLMRPLSATIRSVQRRRPVNLTSPPSATCR